MAAAATHFWYDGSLWVLCLTAGLVGGTVYVQAFQRIASDIMPRTRREFALGAASLADNAGIMLADGVGVLLQGCLYRAQGVEGADFACGARRRR